MVHLAFNSVSWDQLPLPLHNLWTFRHLQLHPNTMTNIPLRIRSFIALSIFVFLITMRCWSGFSWHIQTRMLNAEIYTAVLSANWFHLLWTVSGLTFRQWVPLHFFSPCTVNVRSTLFIRILCLQNFMLIVIKYRCIPDSISLEFRWCSSSLAAYIPPRLLPVLHTIISFLLLTSLSSCPLSLSQPFPGEHWSIGSQGFHS